VTLGPLTLAFLAELALEFPSFRLVPKSESRLSRLIHLLLLVVTCGQMRSYLSHYHTQLGSTLYLAPGWQRLSDVGRVVLLRHERVHLRQRRRYTFLGFALLYLLPVLPLGLAWGRARLEWEAYTETLAATWELLGPERASDPRLRHEVVRRFTGPDYGWMWPFPSRVQRWYDQALEQIEQNSRLAHEGTLPVGPEFAIASSAVRSRSPTHPQSEEPS